MINKLILVINLTIVCACNVNNQTEEDRALSTISSSSATEVLNEAKQTIVTSSPVLADRDQTLGELNKDLNEVIEQDIGRIRMKIKEMADYRDWIEKGIADIEKNINMAQLVLIFDLKLFIGLKDSLKQAYKINAPLFNNAMSYDSDFNLYLVKEIEILTQNIKQYILIFETLPHGAKSLESVQGMNVLLNIMNTLLSNFSALQKQTNEQIVTYIETLIKFRNTLYGIEKITDLWNYVLPNKSTDDIYSIVWPHVQHTVAQTVLKHIEGTNQITSREEKDDLYRLFFTLSYEKIESSPIFAELTKRHEAGHALIYLLFGQECRYVGVWESPNYNQAILSRYNYGLPGSVASCHSQMGSISSMLIEAGGGICIENIDLKMSSIWHDIVQLSFNVANISSALGKENDIEFIKYIVSTVFERVWHMTFVNLSVLNQITNMIPDTLNGCVYFKPENFPNLKQISIEEWADISSDLLQKSKRKSVSKFQYIAKLLRICTC